MSLNRQAFQGKEIMAASSGACNSGVFCPSAWSVRPSKEPEWTEQLTYCSPTLSGLGTGLNKINSQCIAPAGFRVVRLKHMRSHLGNAGLIWGHAGNSDLLQECEGWRGKKGLTAMACVPSRHQFANHDRREGKKWRWSRKTSRRSRPAEAGSEAC